MSDLFRFTKRFDSILGGMTKENLCEKWLPVLERSCYMIPDDQWGDLAQMLENHMAMVNNDVDLFVNVLLPLIVSTWIGLNSHGVSISPIASPNDAEGVHVDPIGPSYMYGIGNREIQDKFDMDQYAEQFKDDKDCESLVFAFATECVKNIVALFKGAKVVYHPYLLFNHGTGDNRMEAVHTWTVIEDEVE